MPSLLGSEEHTSELQSPCNLVCRLCFDRKSTRLNSSHLVISYAVFCLKKKANGFNGLLSEAGFFPTRAIKPLRTDRHKVVFSFFFLGGGTPGLPFFPPGDPFLI